MNAVITIINENNKQLVQDFINILETDGSSTSFRYFISRDINVLKNHVITLIMKNFETNEIIGYAHIDEESGNKWLGICILDNYQGQGYGKRLFETLLCMADDKKIDTIHLSVDTTNTKAYFMYKKYGFEEYNKKNNVIFMKK